MKIISPRLHHILLASALILPITLTTAALRADDRKDNRYHNKQHNDDHEWNSHEDQAYRMWVKERHRKYSDFHKLRARDQQDYWGWRHNHSDAQLKIEIR